ncbi:hypothetical protein AOC10_01775 [Polynucleobacter asymbioticus]|uniref:hypothetical protein n=1 Tax=Polynucleobacter asymbioticus TaxID=576611 RepID=UPI0008FB0B95|nr:hypothetical protein [Polynucleobacter asymbioticus]APC05345.1 hypothetical protein AOC10_01775 [Polynucleobacter asymbioticus]
MFWFSFWMLLASSLGFIKFSSLALILNSVDFGYYISLFGIATLIGAIASFGLIERTTKLYPRLWAEGRRSEVFESIQIIAYRLIFTVAGLMVLGFFAIVITSIEVESFAFFMVFILGLCSSWLSLIASLYRAVGILRALQNFSIVRSLFAGILALAGGWILGWRGAIIGDFVASILTCIYALNNLRGISKNVEVKALKRNEGELVENGHLHLYTANLLTASTSMTDKAIIVINQGAAAAGAYGVVMLLPQAFQMLVNVVSQYLGPLVIKHIHIQAQEGIAEAQIFFQAKILAILACMSVLAILASKNLVVVSGFFAKYEISNTSLILGGVLAAGQIYALLEFHLIALDRERFIFISSFISSLIFFIGFGIVGWLTLGIEFYMASAVISRWLQIALLVYGLKK